MPDILALLALHAALVTVDHACHRHTENARRDRRSQRGALAVRGLLLIALAVSLVLTAWVQLAGYWAWAWLVAVALVAVLTVATRHDRWPQVAGAVLAGAVLALGVPAALSMAALSTATLSAAAAATVPLPRLPGAPGPGSEQWLALLLALAVSYIGLRDLLAVSRLLRPERWRRYPLRDSPVGSGRTVLLTGGVRSAAADGLCRALLARGDAVLVADAAAEAAAAQYGERVTRFDRVTDIPSDLPIDAVVHLPEPPDGLALLRDRDGGLRRSLLPLREVRALIRRSATPPSLIVIAASTDAGRTCMSASLALADRLTRGRPGVRVSRLELGSVFGHVHGLRALRGVTRTWNVARACLVAPDVPRLSVADAVQAVTALLRHPCPPARLDARAALSAVPRGAPADAASRDPAPLTIFYNGACGFCAAEMTRARQQARAVGKAIEFTDINRRPGALAQFGLDFAALESRLYALDARGQLVSGVDAMAALWAHLPGRAWLARMARVPGVHALAALVYDVLLAPLLVSWVRWRRARLCRAVARRTGSS